MRGDEMPSQPHSMKGYEWYSWVEDSQWHFALTTGTNRPESEEETTSGGNVANQDGWVKISVMGVEGIKQVLNGLPQGEAVLWFGKEWREQTGAETGGIRLPPEEIIYDIQEHCKGLGLELQVVN